jgi:hypothetical protein
VVVPAEASTPLVVDLPAGRYRIRLVGPPPDSVVRIATVQAQAGTAQTVTAEPFPETTPEAYFEPYLNNTPQVETVAATAPAQPSRPTASPEAGR